MYRKADANRLTLPAHGGGNGSRLCGVESATGCAYGCKRMTLCEVCGERIRVVEVFVPRRSWLEIESRIPYMVYVRKCLDCAAASKEKANG